MSLNLKPLEDQTIVITGASSGIGLVTARAAAQRGAKTVLVARSEAALRNLADELNGAGHEALAVEADVSDKDYAERVVTAAKNRFGGFDTWVNNAGVGMYGRILDVPVDDMKALFETNFWGLVRGSLAAVRHFKERPDKRYAGALINLGSVLSYQAIPLQGPYLASKHAVKGFSDAFRMELEKDGVPVSLTVIMPNAINTQYAQNAPRYTEQEPTTPPPVYAPETVARAILHAATTQTRDLTVGGAFKPVTALENVLPRVVDGLMKTFMFAGQQKDEPARPGDLAALHQGGSRSGELVERGEPDRVTLPFSPYTQARMHPLATTAVLAGVGLLAVAAVNRLGDRDEDRSVARRDDGARRFRSSPVRPTSDSGRR